MSQRSGWWCPGLSGGFALSRHVSKDYGRCTAVMWVCAALLVQWFAFSLETHISLSFDLAKDGIADILHSRKHHKVQTASYSPKGSQWGGGLERQTLVTILKLRLVTFYHSWSGPMALWCSWVVTVNCGSCWNRIGAFPSLSPWFPGPPSTRIKANLRNGFGPLVRERRGKKE